MSSGSAKTAVAAVGIGALAATGFGLAGVGPLAGLAGAGSGVGMGTVGIGSSTISGLGFSSATAAGAVGGGGFFAGMSGFQAASLGLGALSMGSNLMGGMSSVEGAQIQNQQIEAEQRRREIQANIDRARALENFNRARGTMMNNAAARGVNPNRDIMAQIEKGESYLQDELGAIGVNIGTDRTVAGLQMASNSNQGSSGMIRGLTGAGRSLLTTYQDYDQSRTA